MNYQIRIIHEKKYVELISTTVPISTENDVLDVIALCWEHETNLLMIHYNALADEFFDLKTKLAGNIIQKLINYGIKTVNVIPKFALDNDRFREMVFETNKSNHLRMYESIEDAEKWLIY
ncbi:MAG: DUF4180 domain-containing protein [Clostridiales bacterium]|jgi:hypothetical protein|nr:DUF4180 domain-containing protein [Clostridiales bacterium]